MFQVSMSPDVATFPLDSPLPNVGRALIVGAHPDDADYACGGLILRLRAAGSEVSILVVSDGDKGISASKEDRREEQIRAAKVLDVSDVKFLDYSDGEIWDTIELRREIVRVIRNRRPDVLITHDPLTRRYRQHPDHRAVGAAALAAAFPAARMETYFPEFASQGLEPWIVSHALLFASDSPNWFVELSEEQLKRKLEALQCHESQTGSFGPSLEAKVRSRAREAAAATAFALAEGFVRAELA
jgi:LmbE family N-acetylglucosaminyl deacetylase